MLQSRITKNSYYERLSSQELTSLVPRVAENLIIPLAGNWVNGSSTSSAFNFATNIDFLGARFG